MVFGVLVVVLGIINRMFLQNIAMSAIVVTLVIVFLLVLVWFSLHSRNITSDAHPKRTKHYLSELRPPSVTV